MALEVVTVAYGPSAHAELARRVEAAKASDPLAPVTVVVPSNYVGVAARRRLAAERGVIGVTFLTLYRLAELLGSAALAGAERRPLSNPVLLVAVQEELRQSPGVFAPVSDHPATEEALVAAHRQLSDLSEPALVRAGRGVAQAHDVVGLHRRVRPGSGSGSTRPTSWRPRRHQLRAGHPVGAGLGTVVVLLPQELSRRGATLLREVGGTDRVVVLAGRTGAADADHAVERSVGWLGGRR